MFTVKCKPAIDCRNSAYIESPRGIYTAQPCGFEKLMAKFSPCAAEMLGAFAPAAALYYRRKYIPVPNRDAFPVLMGWSGAPESAPEPVIQAISLPLGDYAEVQAPLVLLPNVISAAEAPEAVIFPALQAKPGSTIPEPESEQIMPEPERPDEIKPEEAGVEAFVFEQLDEAGDEMDNITDMNDNTNTTALAPISPENGNALSEESRGLLHYKKWWLLRHIDLRVNGEMLSGTPIFVEKGTMRLVDKSYSYFIPLSKVDYIRTQDGFDELK